MTTGRHGSVSLDVGGGFWGGRAQGQQVAACLSAGPDRKCSAEVYLTRTGSTVRREEG